MKLDYIYGTLGVKVNRSTWFVDLYKISKSDPKLIFTHGISSMLVTNVYHNYKIMEPGFKDIDVKEWHGIQSYLSEQLPDDKYDKDIHEPKSLTKKVHGNTKEVTKVRKNFTLSSETITQLNTLVDDFGLKSLSAAVTKAVAEFYLEQQKKAIFAKVDKEGF